MNIFNHSITSGARPAFSQGLRGMAQIDDVEGEDQGNAVRKACEGLKISVRAIRERELDERILGEHFLDDRVRFHFRVPHR